MPRYFLTSVTRISDFDRRELTPVNVPREQWRTGDYVIGRIPVDASGWYQIEVPDGRLVEVLPGDEIVGVLGSRHATLEIVGDWHAIGDDLRMECLTIAGVLGVSTSRSLSSRSLIPLTYEGHIARDGGHANMDDFVPDLEQAPLTMPVVLIIGTSMDSGKTTSAKTLVRYFKHLGLRVAGAKLTGVGRYRDILAMRDAGADCIFDFVDAGMPSTLGPPEEYRRRLRTLLAMIEGAGVDVLVAEAGASPLEPYNGDVAVAELGEQVRYLVLCASDPYAVVGVQDAFQATPDLVAGRATSTTAGIALIEKLAGVPAVNLLDPHCFAELDRLLRLRLQEQGALPAARDS